MTKNIKCLIVWNKVPSIHLKQKKAMKELIQKYGNCMQAGKHLKRCRQQIHRWLYKDCKPGENLMLPATAKDLQEESNIPGLAARLCPKAKKEKKL